MIVEKRAEGAWLEAQRAEKEVSTQNTTYAKGQDQTEEKSEIGKENSMQGTEGTERNQSKE